MKKICVWIIIALGALMETALPSRFMANPFIHTRWDADARSFISDVMSTVVKTWDSDQFIDHLSVEMTNSMSREQCEKAFFLFKSLGSLLRHGEPDGYISRSETAMSPEFITGSYVVDAVFEHGEAKLYFSLVKEQERWRLLGLNVASELFDVPGEIGRRVDSSDLSQMDRASLEAVVRPLLDSMDSVELRRHVDKAYRLAELYIDAGDIQQGIDIYDRALQSDASNFPKQYRLAQLLIQSGAIEESVPRLYLVYEYTEQPEIRSEAATLLVDHDMPLPVIAPESEIADGIELLLIPVGDVDMQVVQELRVALQDRLGIRVSLAESAVEPGHPDRLWRDQYYTELFGTITQQLNRLQIDELLKRAQLAESELHDAGRKKKFIDEYLLSVGRSGVRTREYIEAVEKELGEKGQYDATRVIQVIRDAYPFHHSKTVKGYIGVTSLDIYSGSANYVFGSTVGSYCIISYHQFLASINRDKENRPRLIQRLLKQAMSSTGFMFSVPRCNNPYCARAFPLSIIEHDAKSDRLCPLCTQRFKAYLANPVSPAMASEYATLAREYAFEDRFEDAIPLYQEAIRESPGDWSHYYGLGWVYASSKQYSLAVEPFEKALALNPEDVQTQISLGSALLDAGQPDRAMESLQHASILHGTNDAVMLLLGQAATVLNKFDDATRIYSDLLARDPQNTNIIYLLARSYYNEGVVLSMAGNISEAELKYKKSLRHIPDYLDSLNNLALMLAGAGRLQEALGYFQRISELLPNEAIRINDIAYTYFQLKQYDDARAEYERALRLDDRLGIVHYNKAILHFSLREYKDAIRHRDIAEELGYPGSAAFKSHLDQYR